MRVERHSLLSAYRRQTTKQLSAVFSDLADPLARLFLLPTPLAVTTG